MLLLRSSNLIQSPLPNVHFWLGYSLLCQVVSLQWFCPCDSEKYKVINSNIWCIPTQLLPHLQLSQACPQSSFDHCCINLVLPFFTISQNFSIPLKYPLYSHGLLQELSHKYSMKSRSDSFRPHKISYFMMLSPTFSFLRPALGVIILLKSTKWLTIHHFQNFFGPHMKSSVRQCKIFST